MGIRIHKILGYGIDVKLDQYTLIDDRFNVDALDWERLESLSKEDYIEFLKKKQEELDDKDTDKYAIAIDMHFLYKQDKFDATKSIVCNFEYGLNYISIVPPTQVDRWYRYDDVIDYYESSNIDGPINNIKYIEGGIYPFNYSCMRKSTGKNLDPKEPNDYLISRIKYLNHENLLDIIIKLGFSSVEEFDNEIVPAIPIEVRLFCEFIDLFKDNKTINELRPSLYTYWG